MNFFGTFAYGNIIKTFIPGIFIVFGLALLADCISYWIDQTYAVLQYSASNPVLTIGLIIPASIFAGILSNSICFAWLTPKFIGDPYERNNSEFVDYNRKLVGEMKKHYINILGITAVS